MLPRALCSPLRRGASTSARRYLSSDATVISKASIDEAYVRLKAYVHRTPVIECSQMDARAGKKIFMKGEHLQRVGAFKIRGAVNAVALSQADIIVTQSSGNHAQAIALACKLLGKRAIVIMPSNSPQVKVDAVRDSYDGEVIFCPPTQEDRERTCAELVQSLKQEHGEGMVEEVHPNQDPRVVNGQGTIALELLEQMQERGETLDAIVVSVGGGGLIGGIATYVKAISPSTLIIGAETERACSAFNTKAQGKLVTNPPNAQIESIADSIKSSLGPNTYPIVMEHVDACFTCSEEEIVDAMKFTMERSKQVIEGGCGVAVAVAMSEKLHAAHPNLKYVGVILCGGNVDLMDLPWMK